MKVTNEPLVDVCRRPHIRDMSLFGSILQDDFGPDSDVDVLVEFRLKDIPCLMTLAGGEIELSELAAGRKVDMHTRGGISKYLYNET